jgi:hypothetical protein
VKLYNRFPAPGTDPVIYLGHRDFTAKSRLHVALPPGRATSAAGYQMLRIGLRAHRGMPKPAINWPTELFACARVPASPAAKKKPSRQYRNGSNPPPMPATSPAMRWLQSIPVRVADSAYLEKPTTVQLRTVSLSQLVDFLCQLSGGENGPQVKALRLTTPHLTEDDNRWSVELTLTYLIYSPPPREPGKGEM